MMVMHVWPYGLMESRGLGYMKNASAFFQETMHVLYLLNCSEEDTIKEQRSNVVIAYELENWSKKQKRDFFRKHIYRCDGVILHGLRKGYENIFKEIIKRDELNVTWVVWGHEVYNDYYSMRRYYIKHPIRSLAWKRYEYYFEKLVKHVSIVIGEKQDCDRVCELFKYRGKRINYNFGGYADLEIPSFDAEKVPYKRVLIGHNAYPDCRHLECLQLVKKIDDGELVIVCPLIYEGEEPALVREVREKGAEWFGERFFGIYSKQNYNEYCEMLSKCDIALFNHTRQMAQGNVEKLLYYGKKVYFSDENTNYQLYNDLGAYVYKVSEIDKDTFFVPLSEIEQKTNKLIIEKQLLPDTFVEVWNSALGG